MKADRELDIKEVLLYLWQHIAIIIVCMLAGAFGYMGAVYFQSQSELPYNATALIYFDTQGKSNTNGSEQLQFYGNISNLTNVIVKSGQVLEPVAENLELEINPTDLSNLVSVDAVGNSSFMRLTVRWSNPEMAESICNEILEIAPNASASMTNLGILRVASNAEITSVAKPNLAKALVVGGLVGVILSVLVLIGAELFDHQIRDAGDIAYYLDTKTLGVLPMEAGKTKPAVSSEAYRSLCLNLLGRLPQNICSVVLVSGVCANSMSALVSEKMAKTFGWMGKKVLLIDADLQDGAVSAEMELTGTAGLKELLCGDISSDKVLAHNEKLDCTIIPCGAKKGTFEKELSSSHLDALIENFRTQFDIILISTSCVMKDADAAVLSRVANGVALVARTSQTPIESAVLAKEKLELVKAPVFGAVLTDYNYKKARRRDGYYYIFSADRG